jgi:hypothetical protein
MTEVTVMRLKDKDIWNESNDKIETLRFILQDALDKGWQITHIIGYPNDVVLIAEREKSE